MPETIRFGGGEVSGDGSTLGLDLRVFGHGGHGALELLPTAPGDVLLKREDHQAIQIGAEFRRGHATAQRGAR